VEILNAQLEGIGLSFAMTVDDLSEVERLSEVAETPRQGTALSFYTSSKSRNLGILTNDEPATRTRQGA